MPVAGCVEVGVVVIIFAASIDASVEEILPQAIDCLFNLLVCGVHWLWAVFETKAKEGSEIERGLCVCVSGEIVCGHV